MFYVTSWFLVLCSGCRVSSTKDYSLVELPQLKLLEDARVYDAGHSERSVDNGIDGGQEMVNWRPRLVMISECCLVQLILQRRYDLSSVSK